MKLTTVLCAILTLFSIQLENNDKNSVVLEKNKHTLNYVRQKSFSTKKIQSTNIHYTKINEIVNNLMGNKEIKKIENLYDIHFDLMYYLVTFEDSGYLIYDLEAQDYQEYSETSSSPYSKYENEMKIYVGPGNYCYLDDGTLKDIASGNTISTSDQNNLETIYENIQDSKEESQNEESTDSANDTNSINSLPSSYDLPYSYYFTNLHENYADNYLGSCGYIALQITLGYFNNFGGQGGLIPDEYIEKEQVYSEDPSQWTESAGSNYNFHYKLLTIGSQLNYSSAVSMSQLKDIHDEYNDQFASSYNFVSENNILTAFVNLILPSLLYQNYVVILGVSGIDSNVLSGQNIRHAVTAYGYVNGGDGYRVHFGEKELDLTNVVIKDYTIESYFALKYTSSHKHSQNYYYVEPEVITYMCPCGEYSYHYHDWEYTNLTSSSHTKVCKECNATIENEAHTFIGPGIFKTCSECGYSKLPSVGS